MRSPSKTFAAFQMAEGCRPRMNGRMRTALPNDTTTAREQPRFFVTQAIWSRGFVGASCFLGIEALHSHSLAEIDILRPKCPAFLVDFEATDLADLGPVADSAFGAMKATGNVIDSKGQPPGA